MTAPYQQQAPHRPGAVDAQPSYISPIPVRPAHLGDALASEWTKIRSLRSTMWTLGVMVLLVTVPSVLLAVAIAATETTMLGSALELGLMGMLLGSVCVITLGVLTITSEFGTGMIRTTLTACPSRGRVLAAKSIVFFLVVFVLTTLVATLVAMVETWVVDTAATATGEEWFRATVGVGLFVAMLGLVSLAVGTILRHSAGAITSMIGLVLLPYVLAISFYTDALTDLRDALIEYSIPTQLAALYSSGAMEAAPSGWQPLLIILGVTAVAMGGAYLSLTNRDV